MAIFDIQLPKRIAKALRLPINSPRNQQLRVLKKLLRKARFTEFGQQYNFDEILMSKHVGKKFQELVPTYNYNKIYAEWWHKTLEGKPDVCWPGNGTDHDLANHDNHHPGRCRAGPHPAAPRPPRPAPFLPCRRCS